MKKVALLFLTRQALHQAYLWQEELRSCPACFNIYIHSKEPLEDPFWRTYRIQNIVPTTYFNHCYGWQALLQTALEDSSNEKFVFLSESCVPLYPLKLIYAHLIQDDYSYAMYGRPWWDEDNPREIVELPKEHRWGGAEWMILNRTHARLVVEDRDIITLTQKHTHDAESYPLILFSIHHCLEACIYRQITYAITDQTNFPHAYEFNQWDASSRQHLIRARQNHSLFARKFAPEFPQDKLHSFMHSHLFPVPTLEELSFIMQLDEVQTLPLKQHLDDLYLLEEMQIANACAMLCLLINQLGLKRGVEVGTFGGLHAKEILEHTDVISLLCLDVYDNCSAVQLQPLEWESVYKTAQQFFSDYFPRVELLRQSSIQTAAVLSDHSLDFVFLQEVHCCETITELLYLWHPIVRPGGIIAGFRPLKQGELIPQEVEEFFQKQHAKTYHVNRLETGFWWAVLPPLA